MFCKNCGEELQEDSIFCKKCGDKILVNVEKIKKVNINTSKILNQTKITNKKSMDNKTENKLNQKWKNKLKLICLVLGVIIIVPSGIILNNNNIINKQKKHAVAAAVAITNSSNINSSTISNKNTINAEIECNHKNIEDGKINFNITTNFPNKTKLMITLTNKKNSYGSKINLIVSNTGTAIVSFGSKKLPLQDGDYTINIVTLPTNSQPNSVKSLFGKMGKNLIGTAISDDVTDGITAGYLEDFTTPTVTSNTTPDPSPTPISPSIGMTADEVKSSNWGSPQTINRTTTANGTTEQWVYVNNKYIYLDNGIVTAIQD